MAMKTAFAPSFANGQPIWDASVIADSAGARGEFKVLPSRVSGAAAYNLGDFISVDFVGVPYVGVVTRIDRSTTETTVQWKDPTVLIDARSVWTGWRTAEIIDMFAKDLAMKRPA